MKVEMRRMMTLDIVVSDWVMEILTLRIRIRVGSDQSEQVKIKEYTQFSTTGHQCV